MIGAIIGDIVGSRFEWHNIKSKEFNFLKKPECFFTDDSVMTVAVAEAIMNVRDGVSADLADAFTRGMYTWGNRYPDSGYGGRFSGWLMSDDPRPYNSWGNGSAMRVSPCGFAAGSLEEALSLARASAEVTHNHPEGIKGAEATAAAIWLAREGLPLEEIRGYLTEHYYPLDRTLDEIRPGYTFNESCQDTVPQALEAFLESTSFEDAIRNAISLGGDSDTLAAITGGAAEAYWGVPADLYARALTFLPADMRGVVARFEKDYGCYLTPETK